MNDILVSQSAFIGVKDNKDEDFLNTLDLLLSESKGMITFPIKAYIRENLYWGKIPILVKSTGEIVAFADESFIGKNIMNQIDINRKRWGDILVKSGRITRLRVLYKGLPYNCDLDVIYLGSYDFFVIGLSLSPVRN